MTLERHDAWKSWELQVLYDLVNEKDWLDEARDLLRARSRNAIETKMCLLRQEAGIVPKSCGPKAAGARLAAGKRAAEGSRKLAAALLALDESAPPPELVQDEEAAAVLSEHERREADTLTRVHDELLEGRIELQLEFFDGPLFEWRQAA
jgi:hypothetical protein